MNTHAIAHPEFRLAGAMPLASLLTLALLFGMHLLIQRDYEEPVDEEPFRIVPFIMEETPKIVTLYEQPQKVDEPVIPPVAPDPVVFDPGATGGSVPAFTKPTTEKPILTKGYGGGTLVKQVMLAPTYPSRALSRGIEGYVDVSYDVTAYGATENIRVLYAEPEGVFERAALAAVAKWKFRPQEIDGEAVPSLGLRERIRFSLEK